MLKANDLNLGIQEIMIMKIVVTVFALPQASKSVELVNKVNLDINLRH